MDERPSPLPADLLATGFVGLIEGLRADVREDLAELRADMTTRVGRIEVQQADTRELILDFAKGHGQVHEDEALERRREHGIFHDFIRKAELDQARRDGALGILRFGVELFSKHSGSFARVILAGAALWGIASGAISVGLKS